MDSAESVSVFEVFWVSCSRRESSKVSVLIFLIKFREFGELYAEFYIFMLNYLRSRPKSQVLIKMKIIVYMFYILPKNVKMRHDPRNSRSRSSAA